MNSNSNGQIIPQLSKWSLLLGEFIKKQAIQTFEHKHKEKEKKKK